MSARIDGRVPPAASSRIGRNEPRSPSTTSAATPNDPASSEERRRGRRGEQEGAERWPDELVGDDLRGVEAAVRDLERVAVDDVRQDRLRGVVEQRLGGTEGERDEPDEQQGGCVGEHEHARAVPIASIRNPSTTAIVRLRSSRSASAPPISAKNSQGNVPANDTAAMLVGERVSDAARSGSAASVTPSPRLDTVAAAQSRT